jgi:hypothetical protein
MGFWQYLHQWLSMSFSHPWSILQAVLGAVAVISGLITATKPRWAERMKKYTASAWKVAGLIFAIVFVVAFIYSSYALYQGSYLQYQADLAKVSNELDVISSKILVLQKAEAIAYSNQMPTQMNNGNIVFPIYSNISNVVNNRIFNSCTLFFEGENIYFRNCKIVNGSAKGITRFIVMNTTPNWPAILFVDYVLDSCWFVDANIIGSENEIAYCENNIAGGER